MNELIEVRKQNGGHGERLRYLILLGQPLKHKIREIKSKLALASWKLEKLPCLVSIDPVRNRDGWMGWNEMIAAPPAGRIKASEELKNHVCLKTLPEA